MKFYIHTHKNTPHTHLSNNEWNAEADADCQLC